MRHSEIKTQEGTGTKVLMLVSNPCTNDPRVFNEARSLIQAGYKVHVIARNWDKRNPPRENWDGIEVIRVRTLLAPRQGFGSVLWNGFSLILWQWQAYRQALILKNKSGFDIVHCHDLDTLLVGIRLKRKLNLPLIYDAHEIYGYMVADDFPSPIVNLFLIIEKKLLKYVDQIINVTEAQRRYYVSITDKPISVIMNCKPLQSLEYVYHNSQAAFTLIYIGVLHQGRLIPMLLDAVSELPDIHCIIGGVGQAKYVQEIEEKCRAVRNAEFIGQVPFDEVINLTQKADVVILIVDAQNANNRIGLGNKQFEAMVCGKPIICSKGTYSGELTEQEETGLTVDSNKEALKQAIIKLRDNPELTERLGRNALRAAITKYNWHKQEEKLIELYRGMKL